MGLGRSLPQQHRHGGEDSGDKKLYAGHPDPVNHGAEVINHHDMDGESERAKQNKKVPLLQGERACHTEKIESDHCNDNAAPKLDADLLLQKQSENRYNNNV